MFDEIKKSAKENELKIKKIAIAQYILKLCKKNENFLTSFYPQREIKDYERDIFEKVKESTNLLERYYLTEDYVYNEDDLRNLEFKIGWIKKREPLEIDIFREKNKRNKIYALEPTEEGYKIINDLRRIQGLGPIEKIIQDI